MNLISRYGVFKYTKIVVFVFFVCLQVAHAQTIYVPDDYSKIQWAVANATVGDVVIVRDGTYIENVVINVSITLRSENGSSNCTIRALNTASPVISVLANDVQIIGFTIEGTQTGVAGISVTGDNCYISENLITDNGRGVYLSQSSGNSITMS